MEYYSEITVTLKAEDKKYTQVFPVYETYTANQDDPLILQCIEDAKKYFKEEPEEIKIRINIEVV